jgi:hypothetical protein
MTMPGDATMPLYVFSCMNGSYALKFLLRAVIRFFNYEL